MRFGLILIVCVLCAVAPCALAARVSMEKVPYGGWPNCVRISKGEVELIATTDVGPRIIRFGFVGGQNVFKEFEPMMGKTGGEEWRVYGGHRLWHGPEQIPRTYAPDNEPVQWDWNGQTLRLVQAPEPENRVQKEMKVTMDEDGNVRVIHRITNLNPWEIELAPWGLSVMAPGGRAIIPQEPFIPHEEYLLAARPLVLWHYSKMNDPRWTWGDKFIQLRQDPAATTKQKVGLLNKRGWVGYSLNGEFFVKRYTFDAIAKYPDYGCNTETFTNAEMLEVETLGPLTRLEPQTGWVEHEERWSLYKAEIGTSDDEIAKAVEALGLAKSN